MWHETPAGWNHLVDARVPRGLLPLLPIPAWIGQLLRERGLRRRKRHGG
jgi:hypothetical protein